MTTETTTRSINMELHEERVIQKVINFFDANATADHAGIILGKSCRDGLKKLIREIQDEARI